ncbi:MAG: hypothetical protein HFI19_09160 [Lachnospiraceae bacterium]|nr:hypothetical protein [Lachnospiraceae bacterium]
MKKPLTGSALKWIAILTMLIDHVGACLIEVFVMNAHGTSPLAGRLTGEQIMAWYDFDIYLRLIGRVSFPIFCFLLVEGAVHTRNMGKYMLRLTLFALLSEVPFDLAFHNMLFFTGGQNVFLTLAMGLLAVWILKGWRQQVWRLPLGLLLPAFAAQLLLTDYGAVGVLVIVLMYLLRERPWLRAVVCVFVLVAFNSLEWPTAFSFLLIALYNGERGRQPKYFFYGFYPGHLLMLWAVGRFLLVNFV